MQHLVVLAVQGHSARADAYGVAPGLGVDPSTIVRGATPHSDAEIASVMLLLQGNNSGSWTEIAFDEAGIEGTFHEPGRPGVIGLWLSAFTVAGTTGDFDATAYGVPDLRPAANGFMFERGFVWAPPHPKRAYP